MYIIIVFFFFSFGQRFQSVAYLDIKGLGAAEFGALIQNVLSIINLE